MTTITDEILHLSVAATTPRSPMKNSSTGPTASALTPAGSGSTRRKRVPAYKDLTKVERAFRNLQSGSAGVALGGRRRATLPAKRHPMDVGLLHDGAQRLFGPAPRL